MRFGEIYRQPTLESLLKSEDRESLNLIERNREQIQGERNKENKINERIQELVGDAKTIHRFVRRYTGKEINVKEIEGGYFEIEVENELLDELPDGYVYKGGAARAILERQMGVNAFAKPRDIDIAVRSGMGNNYISDKLSKEYMADDYAHGHGVEKLEDDYFESRDFTVNEILYDGNKIIATKQCILDTVRCVVRITEYEKQERLYDKGDYYVKPKLLAKALRFISEKKMTGLNSYFGNEEVLKWIGIDDFHIALHLDRAAEQSDDVAMAYIDELKKRNILPESINSIKIAMYFLSENLKRFVFKSTGIGNQREIDDEIIDNEEFDFYEELGDRYERLPLRESINKIS